MDLSYFYDNEVIKDRPSEYRLQKAITDVATQNKTLEEASNLLYDTRMWQWFDIYRIWSKGDMSNLMIDLPTLEEANTELYNHFRNLFKLSRSEIVNNLTVVVDGYTFDADEASQSRMKTAILSALDDVETTHWVLADNSVVQLNRLQLQSALRASALAMSSIWLQP